ncbi:RPOL4c domain-containing protein [Chloropicon primus]|uniref:RNA polymerase Rpb4/RPC9 core domain-containing protein n=1 Tax=Chloropicon primus TaxID=1764295 RepID=A0A5B8MSE5_9CHLO|nr:hypothetical protein A3770_10p59210 [Chloropicon primus]UPR02615.1 RPOL4c domain-containing protein [Chloropicon primus]|mmetsp:Transcript_6840/g.19980  ORF Transcript_6840/g.19980 Transcript_6840/m.19980 type:complete len:144 (+) Transcript_6840:236-667(+)|eukprot:QDZ23403.1 hypothetical protein A3770_10p59210 [Chloropicon primus]
MANKEGVIDDINDIYESKDFENARMLFISDVEHILNENLNRRKEQEGTNYEFGPVVDKAFSYAKRFSTFNSTNDAQAFREELSNTAQYGFQEHEITLLGNLCPDNLDEAVHLIPSIKQHVAEGVEGAEKIDRAISEVQKHCRQ